MKDSAEVTKEVVVMVVMKDANWTKQPGGEILAEDFGCGGAKQLTMG